MGKKVIRLTESDLEKLINKVLSEQSMYESKSFKPLNYGSLFNLGEYQDTSGKIRKAIENDKQAIVDFINSQNSSTFTANIMAGESQVTNPKGFERKGSLALARAKTIGDILTDVYSDLINDEIISIKMPTLTDVKIGSTPYKPGDQKDPSKLEKYKKEQFVTMTLQGSGKSLKCNTPFPVKGNQAKAPNFEYVYGEELRLNPKIKGINYNAFTIPDRPILIDGSGNKKVPPYFLREKRGTSSQELRFPLELAVKSHIYPNSEAFAGVEYVDSFREKVVPYVRAGISGQQTIGAILVQILKESEEQLTDSLKQLLSSLENSKNTLTANIFNENKETLKSVFGKSPKIVTNPNGFPFDVNMQQTPSIKVGSYAPLMNTVFEITPYC